MPPRPMKPTKPNKPRDGGSKAIQHFSTPGTSLSLVMNVFPRQLMRKLRYAETFTLTAGAAGVLGTAQLMRVNSVFDPNQTGAGHQPYGFDQLALFYSRYIVHSATFRLTSVIVGGTNGACFAFQVGGGNGFVTISGLTVDAATEKSMVSTFTGTTTGNTRVVTKVIKLDCFKLLGVTRQQYIDDLSNHAALVTANPIVNLALELCVGSYAGNAADNGTIQFVIDYDVEFFDPVTIAQS